MRTFTRWSGNIRVKVRLTDRDTYTCGLTLVTTHAHRYLGWVGVNPAPSDGVLDSPKQIDSIAHAALSFAATAAEDDSGEPLTFPPDEADTVSEQAAHTAEGWHIARRRVDNWYPK